MKKKVICAVSLTKGTVKEYIMIRKIEKLLVHGKCEEKVQGEF